MDFLGIKVKSIEKLTSKATAIYFDLNSTSESMDFKAGQYLTLKFNLDGEEYRRDYSIFSSPESGELGIGVKRVEGGKISNYINDQLKAGDIVNVTKPQGRFCLPEEPDEEYVLMACGSGITPVLSLLQKAVSLPTTKKVQLLYANKSQEDTMFHEQIIALADQYSDKLNVTFFYSRSYTESDAGNNVTFREGRMHENFVQTMIESGVFHRKAQFFICGPEDLTRRMETFLKRSLVAENHIHHELFTALKVEAATNTSSTADIEINLYGEAYKFSMDKGHYILENGLSKDIDIPFSCQGGVCTSCMCRVTSGEVDMQENFTLTDEEMDEGYILTCISKPVSDNVVLEFD